jgi:ABC-type transport system substrate-binding protein
MRRFDFSKKPLFILLSYFFLLFSTPAVVYGNESITIGVPYLPSKIDPLNDTEPVTRIIIKNISASLIKNTGERNPVAANKIARRIDPSDELPVWELEFTKGVPLEHQQNFQSSVIRDSFRALMMLKEFPNANTSSITKLIESTDSIILTEYSDRFSAIFKLSRPFKSFPEILAKVPLIDHSLAQVFGKSFGESTNLPLYGPFKIMEHRPGEEIRMIRNEYFGFPGEQSHAHSVTLKVFNETDAAMRALRAGSISMIALPCAYLIEDAKRDATLRIIPSPLMNEIESDWKPMLSHWKSKGNSERPEQDHEIDLKNIIVRKSMELTPEFVRSFDLKNISKGDL